MSNPYREALCDFPKTSGGSIFMRDHNAVMYKALTIAAELHDHREELEGLVALEDAQEKEDYKGWAFRLIGEYAKVNPILKKIIGEMK